jgi:hypothetical protein
MSLRAEALSDGHIPKGGADGFNKSVHSTKTFST